MFVDRYVDRVTETMTRVLDQSEKMAASARLMVMRRMESYDDAKAAEPKIVVIKTKTLELKKQVI